MNTDYNIMREAAQLKLNQPELIEYNGKWYVEMNPELVKLLTTIYKGPIYVQKKDKEGNTWVRTL